jgi:hypothetical protein
MLAQARTLDYETTGSALEAAILENDEIKQHRPAYNIALRPEGRTLVFATRDLLHWSDRNDRAFSVGPLFAGRYTVALSAFAAWLNPGSLQDASILEAKQRAILGLTSRGGPTPIAMQEGFALFRNRHAHRLTLCALRSVTSIGAQLWRSKIGVHAFETEPKTSDEPDPCFENGLTSSVDWTPDDIAEAIERTLMHAAQLVRRARWFLMLADASLAWATPEDPVTLKNMLLFEKGTIVARGILTPRRRLPIPPGWHRPWVERRKQMTLFTCDRMRVVTTELRRLLGANRTIELRLSPRTALTHTQLRQALRWI